MSITKIKELLVSKDASLEEVISEIEALMHDAYESGFDEGNSVGSDADFDHGYEEGYAAAQAEFETKRDEWFEQGWAEALLEHGIEE